MGAEALSGAGGARPRRTAAGRTKSGKPRPGTGGQGKRKLEGKGPTPPAAMRPGHPAQRRASKPASADGSRARRPGDGPGPSSASHPSSGTYPAAGRDGRGSRGAGDAAEFVAGRNSVVEAGAAELDRLTGGALHQGVALRVRPYAYAHPDDLLARAADAGQLPLIVALDGVTDPRNLGAIVRSAAAFGAHGVVVPSRRGAGVTAGAWKASAGALARVPVARAVNLARALQSYQEAGVFLAGLDAAGNTQIRDLDLATAPLAVVIGSEGRGLSRIVAQACDVLVRIPIAARTESLNAGVAAGIALYEVAAVRSRPGDMRG
jgi:23S rRNA (guanosine2251-2'-O)-methyltransferase